MDESIKSICVALGEEMLDARWLSLEELSKEALFPPFEESIHQLVAILEGGGANG